MIKHSSLNDTTDKSPAVSQPQTSSFPVDNAKPLLFKVRFRLSSLNISLRLSKGFARFFVENPVYLFLNNHRRPPPQKSLPPHKHLQNHQKQHLLQPTKLSKNLKNTT